MVAIKCRYTFEYSEEAPDMPDDELSEYVKEVINRARMLAGFGGGKVVCWVEK